MARLSAGLGCRDKLREATSCTPRSEMVTLSSKTVTVFSAKMESESGEITCETIARPNISRIHENTFMSGPGFWHSNSS